MNIQWQDSNPYRREDKKPSHPQSAQVAYYESKKRVVKQRVKQCSSK